MSANSVFPPLDGTLRACSSEYFAGTTLNELGMPQTVAEGEQPPPVVAGEHLVVLVEIGHVGKGGGQTQSPRLAQARADRVLDLPQTAGEGELLLVVDRLVVEHEHRVPVHSGMDRRHLIRGQRLGHVDAFHFGGEARADLASDDGHWGDLPLACASILDSLLPRLQRQQAKPDAQSEEPARQGWLPRPAEPAGP
jgi:hypothetical protein